MTPSITILLSIVYLVMVVGLMWQSKKLAWLKAETADLRIRTAQLAYQADNDAALMHNDVAVLKSRLNKIDADFDLKIAAILKRLDEAKPPRAKVVDKAKLAKLAKLDKLAKMLSPRIQYLDRKTPPPPPPK